MCLRLWLETFLFHLIKCIKETETFLSNSGDPFITQRLQ